MFAKSEAVFVAACFLFNLNAASNKVEAGIK
jgi:hypothetical protein